MEEKKKNSKTKKTTDRLKKINNKGTTRKVKIKKTPVSVLNSKIITDDFDEIKRKKYNNMIIILLFFVLSIVFLIFLTNKTFFRNSYQNDKFNIKLPLFIYYVSDNDNTLTLKTLRKSQYLKKYFDEYLSNLENFDFYTCKNGKAVYYNDEKQMAIYDIEINKKIAVKTIKIKYDIISSDRICK